MPYKFLGWVGQVTFPYSFCYLFCSPQGPFPLHYSRAAESQGRSWEIFSWPNAFPGTTTVTPTCGRGKHSGDTKGKDGVPAPPPWPGGKLASSLFPSSPLGIGEGPSERWGRQAGKHLAVLYSPGPDRLAVELAERGGCPALAWQHPPSHAGRPQH